MSQTVQGEEILDEIPYVNSSDPEIQAALAQGVKLYDTKDIFVAAFLLARGFKIAKLQRRRVILNPNRKYIRPNNTWHFLFVDHDSARRGVLYYCNESIPSQHNVNASALIAHIKHLKSLIANM